MNSYREWINKAEDDLKVVKDGLGKFANWIILFHAQQAIEKYLKAYLVFHNKKIEKTHDITYLINQCIKINSKFKKLLNYEIEIFEFAISSRYPSKENSLSNHIIKEASNIAEEIKNFVLEQLEKEKNKYH